MKQTKRKELLVPALPGGFRNNRKPPGIFKRLFEDSYLSGSQLYKLTEHMNSEHSRNIPGFLWNILCQLRAPAEISLLLTSAARRDVLEHFVTVERNKDQERSAFSASFENFDVPIDGGTLAQAIRTNHGGQGFFFDSKNQKFRHFSLRPHDFSIGKGRFMSESSSEPRQTVVIPLRSSDSDRVIGCIVIKGEDLRLKTKAFVMSAMTFFAGASRLLYSLVNGQLDPLTKLMRRTAFDFSLLLHAERFLRNPNNQKNHFSVVMSDIDHFKDYNDTYGHQKGDKVLVDVAGVTRSTTRSREGGHDLVARFGGEEFVILYDIDLEKALSAASRLRRNVHNETGVTCSYGIADAETTRYLLSQGMVDLEDLASKFDGFKDMPEAQRFSLIMVYLADKALYHAKETGRDRVAYARQVTPEEEVYATYESNPLEPTQETPGESTKE